MECVIVGSGMAGLTAAAQLEARGWSVTLLDKGKSAGGRMATRRIGESRLDHGAQFFTVRDPRFRQTVERWERAGWVVPWFVEGGHTRYRAVDGMNSLAKRLAERLDVQAETKVEAVEPSGDSWLVHTASGRVIPAGALLLTCPAPQARAILATHAPAEVGAALESVRFDACFALLVTLDGPSKVPSPGYVRPEQGPLEWIADNTQKGISSGPAALTIHSRPGFSGDHTGLLEAAQPWLGSGVTETQVHRWLYSRPLPWNGPPCLFSSQPAPLAIAGDAFGGSKIEGAFLSGLAAAEALG